jgi:hypothetical protein
MTSSDINYEDMLLKRFRITESVIEEARKYNKEHGIDEATSNANLVFTKTNKQNKYHKTTREFMQKLRAVVKF